VTASGVEAVTWKDRRRVLRVLLGIVILYLAWVVFLMVTAYHVIPAHP